VNEEKMELQLLYDRLQLSQLDKQTIEDLWEINNLDSNKKEFCCVLAVLFEQFSNGSLCLPFGVDNQIRLPQEWHETFAKGEELFVSGYFSGVTAVADGKDTAFLPLVLRTLNNGDKLLYFYRCWKSEDMLRQNLKRRLEFVDDNCMQEACCPEENGLEVMQKEAVRQVLQKNFLIVTGGPGTGKTYTAARMIKKTLRVHPEWKVALAAPTGKAAKRLEESLAKENLTDMCGQTLHRLLGITRDSVTAKYNHDNPLPYDLILVDEISMIDVHLFSALLDATAIDTKLILLGDCNQLPSVDAGAVLADLVQDSTDSVGWISKLAGNVVRLDTTRRTENETMRSIFKKIKDGDGSVMNDFSTDGKGVVNFVSLPENEKDAFTFLYDFIRKYVEAMSFSPNAESQNRSKILTVNRSSFWGCKNINNLAESYFGRQKEGTPIIVTGNLYEQNLFNGDCGWLEGDKEKKMVVPDKDGISLRLLDGKYETAFAVTVHKSQGSEYQNVIIILPWEENNALLSREILYTAVTRAKCKVTIIGRKVVFETALKQQIFRYSGLTEE
jgi:exodeoxyribonuclease V alpha subunit